MQDPRTVEAHPMWAKQVELERGMLREGADRVRDRVLTAQRKGKMTSLDPVRGLLEDWLPGIAQAVQDWVKTMNKSKGGPKPIALPLIQMVDPYTVALIGVRALLDGITARRTPLVYLSDEIGRTIEHEAKVRLWEAKEPALFHTVRRKMDKEGVTNTHRRLVNINRFNSLMQEGAFGFGWENWDSDQHFRVGQVVLDTIVRKTMWFDYIPDPDHVFKRGQKRGPKLIIVPKPGLLDWLAKQIDYSADNQPSYMPTVVPPRRWEGSRKGGYWTPYVRTPNLIRFHASQEQQQSHAADEYDALHMPEVYDALHFLQEVPWRVNERVLAVAREVVAKDMGIAGIPVAHEVPLPPRPACMSTTTSRRIATPALAKHKTMKLSEDEKDREQSRNLAKLLGVPEMAPSEPDPPSEQDEAAVLAWKRQAAKVYSRNIKRVSAVKSYSRTLRVAELYKDFTFYFPHMLDFRGRMYPIPVGLQPQGDDLARGLLLFAEGKPVTEENGGIGWLAVGLASAYGNDKISFEDRISWVEQNEGRWRTIAADPLGNHLLWANPDISSPWQLLAAVFEWVDYLDHGPGFVSSLPVGVDGTCNGIQHLSAMTRDHVAGAYVNLVPGDKPRDIYKFVADQLQAILLRMVSGNAFGLPAQQAEWWLNLLGRDAKAGWSRSLTKRPVMVLPYGGTRDSFFTYTREWVEKAYPLPSDCSDDQRKERTALISFLVVSMWDTVNENVTGAMIVMKWLQVCAKAASVGNQPIVWKTASGFVVRHFYGAHKERDVTVMLDGHRTSLKLQETTDRLDRKAQLQGIAPNFVHSQDAAAMVKSINRSSSEGVTAFVAVHDYYGTHAADMKTLATNLRAAFVELHSTDVLAVFRNSCQGVVVDQLMASSQIDPLEASEKADDMLPPLPARGELVLEDVTHSDYFFA